MEESPAGKPRIPPRRPPGNHAFRQGVHALKVDYGWNPERLILPQNDGADERRDPLPDPESSEPAEKPGILRKLLGGGNA